MISRTTSAPPPTTRMPLVSEIAGAAEGGTVAHSETWEESGARAAVAIISGAIADGSDSKTAIKASVEPAVAVPGTEPATISSKRLAGPVNRPVAFINSRNAGRLSPD